jgi:drug/metabolite transporter (DMT)-like permease
VSPSPFHLEVSMPATLSPHLTAVLQALFVTFLWSTSWVLIKIGLQDMPALPFAGLRYTLAFLCLLPFALRRDRLAVMRGLPRRLWPQLLILGLLLYSVAQGAQFLALAYLPAVTVSLLLNFTSVIVALLAAFFLAERPGVWQWLGISLFLAGVAVYFYPVELRGGELFGLGVAVVCVLANAVSAVLARGVNRSGDVDPLTVTVVSMGIGSLVLLLAGLALQGMPQLTLTHWAIIAWLALVNTAFAFTLWNLTMRLLTAVESSILNNTMLIQIALLAWIFLGEQLAGRQVGGLLLAVLGALLVQVRSRRKV